MRAPADCERNRRGRGGNSGGLGAKGPQPLLGSFPLSAQWLGMERAPRRGEGPSAAPRGASRGRRVRREAHCAAVGGVAGIVRLSHMS